MGFLFDLPLILTGPALIVALVGASILGLNWFRKNALPRLRFGEGDVDFSAAMLASIMVFYGLATALIAVNVWEAYEKVKEVTQHEAASLAVLYRNVSEYPEPMRRVPARRFARTPIRSSISPGRFSDGAGFRWKASIPWTSSSQRS
jgi:hypothetical protein